MDGEPIVALATTPGRSAVAVLRVSGHGCERVLRLVTGHGPFVARRATLVDVALGNAFSDRALATWFPAPHSYTGEDAFELALHGSPVVIAAALDVLAQQGVRPAAPGEFTARAFVNGKMDLVEAEAIDDLIRAVTPAQARVASAHLHGALSAALLEVADGLVDVLERLEASLDFPDEGFHFMETGDLSQRLEMLSGRCAGLAASGDRGRLLREGATVVVAGRPNVGKSSLFNVLLGAERAIVTAQAGTTRDVLTETLDIGGVPVTLIDTAGVHETSDVVEREGVARARASVADADVVLVVVDASEISEARIAEDARLWEALDGRARLLVVNKIDVEAAGGVRRPDHFAMWRQSLPACRISVRTGEGLEALRRSLAETLGGTAWEPAMVTNARHLGLLRQAGRSLDRAVTAVAAGATEEYVAVDVREALDALEEIRGRVTPQEILNGIFARFCIGK